MTRIVQTKADSKRPGLSHRQTLSLTGRLLRRLSAALQLDRRLADDGEHERLLLAAGGLLALAARGLMPRWLSEIPWINQVYGQLCSNPVHVDESQFGRRLTKLLQPLCQLQAAEHLTGELGKILQTPELAQLCAEPTWPGWLYQSLRRQPRGRILQAGEYGMPSLGQSAVSPADLPRLTQWFTPDWVCRYLVEQVLEQYSPPVRFIDPACGTGHVLSAAINKLYDLAGNQPPALQRIIGQQIFAADIDPQVVEIAALVVYLTCRDLGVAGELPLPNIFHFQNDAAGQVFDSYLGSLWLGVPDIPADLMLCGLDSVVPLRDSPLGRKFSAVATNPPYLGQRLLPPEVSSFLKQHYYSGRFDLYTAFMSMGVRILADEGKMGLICQQSFLSIQRYQLLRDELLRDCRIESLIQLGSGTFGPLSGDKVSNAILIAARGPAKKEHQIRCRRILDAQHKKQAEMQGITSLPVQLCEASALIPVAGNPLSFWCPAELARLFSRHPPLEGEHSGIVCSNGLFTCDNRRFVKLRNQVDADEMHLYVPYDKGGGQKWYRRTPYVLYWGQSGEAVREFRLQRGQSAKLPGEEYYFQPGITYSYIGTRGFRARLLSPNSAFDVASSAVISRKVELLYVLGFLNSTLVRFLLGVLNPTINFQIGDLRRLPWVMPGAWMCQRVSQAASKAVEAAKIVDAWDISTAGGMEVLLNGFDFKRQGVQAYERYLQQARELNELERHCQQEINECIFELYEIGSAARKIVQNDPWVVRSDKLLYTPLPFSKLATDL